MESNKLEKLEIGKSLAYVEILMICDDLNVHPEEYGEDFIGEGAIHISYKERNYWFVLHQAGNSYYYKLVYNGK